MGLFSKRPRVPPAAQSALGTFRASRDGWMTEPAQGSLTLLYCEQELSAEAVAAAETLLRDADAIIVAARDYARAHGEHVWDGAGELTPELLDITELLTGKFGLTFAVSTDPDFTVTVEFVDGRPQLVWAAD